MRGHDETGDPAGAKSRSWLPRKHSPRPGRRNNSTLILAGLAVLMAVVLVGGSLAVYAKYRAVWDGINRVDVNGDLAGKRPPVDPNALNILLIGSDARAGINGKIGGGSDGAVGGARSDTIMVVHIAPGAHQIVVLSIPRDSVVPILSCTRESRTPGQTAQPSGYIEQINATYNNGGPGCLWETVEQTTGIHINDFVQLNFIGFERVIDVLHGVWVCLPAAVHDHVSHLNRAPACSTSTVSRRWRSGALARTWAWATTRSAFSATSS